MRYLIQQHREKKVRDNISSKIELYSLKNKITQEKITKELNITFSTVSC